MTASCALHYGDPVACINSAIERLDWTSLRAVLEVPGNPGYRLCAATEAEFETYVASEDQELKSRCLALSDGFIFIVELPSGLHSVIARAMDRLVEHATGTGLTHLGISGDTYVDMRHLPPDQRLPRLEPDCSFGPTPVSGAIPPHSSLYWRTAIKAVLAVAGETANTAFMAVRQYKLFSFVNNVLEGPPPAAMAPITADTRVTLDARRLLALPPHARIPDDFNHVVVLRLNDALRYAWGRYPPDYAQVVAPF